MNIPNKIYKGILLNFNEIKNFNFNSNISLQPIYSTNTKIFEKQSIDDSLFFGVNKETVTLPKTSIIYEIDINGLDLNKTITPDNYIYKKIIVEKDLLHDKQEIDINCLDIKYELGKIYKNRIDHLICFAKALNTINESERLKMTNDDINLIKDIYKTNGIFYKDYYNMEVNTNNDLKEKLIKRQLKIDGFDFEKIKDINYFCNSLKNEHLYESILLNIDTKYKDIKDIALKIIHEKQLTKLGASYCNLSKDSALVICDDYNYVIKDGELSITKFNKQIDVNSISKFEKKAFDVLMQIKFLYPHKNKQIQNQQNER